MVDHDCTFPDEACSSCEADLDAFVAANLDITRIKPDFDATQAEVLTEALADGEADDDADSDDEADTDTDARPPGDDVGYERDGRCRCRADGCCESRR
jgi:hypothetical protein